MCSSYEISISDKNPRGRRRRLYLLYCSWDYKVSTIEIEHMDRGESVVRAIAELAEAERSATIVSPCPWTSSMH
jgi:hypothetical protein